MNIVLKVKDVPIIFTADEVAAVLAGDKTTHRVIIDDETAFSLSVIEKQNRADIENQRTEGDTVYLDFDYDMHLKSGETISTLKIKSPFGGVGDRLWTQEEHRPVAWSFDDGDVVIAYRDGKRQRHDILTDEEFETNPNDDYLIAVCDELIERGVPMEDEQFLLEIPEHLPYWRTAEVMPQFASRASLEITSIKVERLNVLNMTDSEIKSEGADHFTVNSLVDDDRISFYQTLFSRHWDAKSPSCTWGVNPWVLVLGLKKI